MTTDSLSKRYCTIVTAQKMRLVCTCQDNAQAMQVQPRPATPVKSAVAIERTPSPPENEPVIPAGDYQDDIPMPTDDDYSVSEDINYDGTDAGE